MAVVGAGPAGLAAACVAAERGHAVTLFDAAAEIGGQFNLAKRIPGKEEFHETLRYFATQLRLHRVELRLGAEVEAEQLARSTYDEIILATGVTPRTPEIPGIAHPKVIGYIDAILGNKPVGQRVAILGAGGIGFDVAAFITQGVERTSLDKDAFWRAWGIDLSLRAPGGLAARQPPPAATREVYLLQRKVRKIGKGLGKTTGWIHRAELAHRRVQMWSDVEYLAIDDAGLHVSVAAREPQLLAVDTIIVCAGQEPLCNLAEPLKAAGHRVHTIGGADAAVELDAKRAIDQGSRLAASL